MACSGKEKMVVVVIEFGGSATSLEAQGSREEDLVECGCEDD